MATPASARYLYVNGELRESRDPQVSALDRGFTLGDGVFETLRSIGGAVPRLAQHLARLRYSAGVIELEVPEPDERLASAIGSLLVANGLRDAVVRLTLSRGASFERGVLPPSSARPTLVIQATPVVAPAEAAVPSGAAAAAGIGALISSVRRNEHSPTSRIKSCNYLDSVLARLEARRAGAEDAIMLNTAGYLACGSTSNLHLVVGDLILTPALECGVLAGITRAAVRELAPSAGLRWEEAWLRPEAIRSADEVFLTNSVLGVVPVTLVDGEGVGSGLPGPIALLLLHDYENSLRGAVGE